jgi:hypothetical protein
MAVAHLAEAQMIAMAEAQMVAEALPHPGVSFTRRRSADDAEAQMIAEVHLDEAQMIAEAHLDAPLPSDARVAP